MNIDELKYRRKLLVEEIYRIDEQINELKFNNLIISPSYETYDYKLEEQRKEEKERRKCIDNIAFFHSGDTYNWNI